MQSRKTLLINIQLFGYLTKLLKLLCLMV